jgi:2-polyprenyl-6-hydroxyphenyl methylase/3-demethylubiquinone-9 3-methyltransferase
MADIKQVENSNNKEIEKFDRLSQTWWNPEGKMHALHAINPLRTGFILESITRPNPKILDVGCGGGILSASLARAGAQVTGLDLSEASIQIARQHALEQGLKIDYRYESVEEVAEKQAGMFDVVTCMEMLEHTAEPQKIVSACAQASKPGGQAFFSTINRTPKAFLFAIIVGEYILHLLPRGCHTYSRFIRPHELKCWTHEAGLEFVRLASLMYNPVTRTFKLAADKEDVNYIAHFIKT